MDTKWKSWITNKGTKLIALLLAAFFLTLSLLSVLNLCKAGDSLDALLEKNYTSSTDFLLEYHRLGQDAVRLLTYYKSEEYIKNGGTLSSSRLKDHLDIQDETSFITDSFGNLIAKNETAQAELDDQKNLLIQSDLTKYYEILDQLNSVPGFYYYVSGTDITYTNMDNPSKEKWKDMGFYALFDLGKFELSQEDNSGRFNFFVSSYPPLNPHTDSVYIGFTEQYMSQMSTQWDEKKAVLIKHCLECLLAIVPFLLMLVFLIYATGKKKGCSGIVLSPIDKLYTEITLILLIVIGGSGAALSGSLYFFLDNYYFAAITGFLASLILIALILSLVRRIKNATIFKHSLLYTIGHKLNLEIKQFLSNKPYTKKLIWMVIGYSVLLAVSVIIFPITIAMIAGAVWYILKKSKDFNNITEGAKRIRSGDIHYKIVVEDSGELKNLAEDINQITDGLNQSIENELRSERLKTELITNVSHDIRTPLTSIITYVDLLKKEGPDSPNALKYIHILEQKSSRLKVLTDDLFDAAKASSGNIDAQISSVDLTSLITQGMGELDDKIKASGLEFKVNTPGPVMVLADGKLLWRVIENLMSNVFKYAMKHSRVYLDVTSEGNQVQLVMKNVSAYELNIAPDELLLRFKRGDEARHSEGSGLGLSIAKSLIEAQNGTFSLMIDGDLFKAVICLPKADQPNGGETNEV